MAAIDGKILLTKNDCYKAYQRMTPKGIVVHSTGANNPNLRRYIAPDDGVIGKNLYNNDWNRGGLDVAVHGFIGLDKNNNVKFYQTLPFDICCWGVADGYRGSYNYDPPYIQFEMCEDDLTDKSYCTKVYNKAVEVCVYLCKEYKISVDNIVSHKEAHEKGYGSDHIDPTNWWNKHGYTMSGFRKAVREKLAGNSTSNTTNDNKNTSSNTSGLSAGTKLTLSNVALYGSSTAKAKASTKTGTYYVWDNEVINGRIRITNSTSNVGNAQQVTGWIAESDAKKATGTTNTSSGFKPYVVTITATDGVNIRKGAGTNYAVVGAIAKGGAYTIVEEKDGKGANKWGKLKSGAGWIALDYTEKI